MNISSVVTETELKLLLAIFRMMKHILQKKQILLIYLILGFLCVLQIRIVAVKTVGLSSLQAHDCVLGVHMEHVCFRSVALVS